MGSEESEIIFRLTRRMILVMQTLLMLVWDISSSRDQRRPYNPPRANMIINAIFCLRGKSTAIRAGIGIRRIARSVVMCMLAFENHSPGWLRQCPLIEASQNLATGIQLRNALITAQVPYMPRIEIMIQQMTRIRCVGKTRKYCIKMEAFAQRTAAL